ncbi:MAG: hypothetical protein U0871_06665 [Gemmataceae bacterium]
MLNPYSECTITNFAAGLTVTCWSSSRVGTPSHRLSSFDQRVTQCMSASTFTRGSA